MEQLDAFAVGQVKAHLEHGLGPYVISQRIVKADGHSHWSHTAITKVVAKLGADKSWRGERQPGSGRRRKTTVAEDRKLMKEVIAKRGKRKVLVVYLRKTFKFAMKLKFAGSTQ